MCSRESVCRVDKCHNHEKSYSSKNICSFKTYFLFYFLHAIGGVINNVTKTCIDEIYACVYASFD